MKKIVYCPNGLYALPVPAINYLKQNGYPQADQHSFDNNRIHPALIAAMEAAQNIPVDVMQTGMALHTELVDILKEHSFVIPVWEQYEKNLFRFLQSVFCVYQEKLMELSPIERNKMRRMCYGTKDASAKSTSSFICFDVKSKSDDMYAYLLRKSSWKTYRQCSNALVHEQCGKDFTYHLENIYHALEKHLSCEGATLNGGDVAKVIWDYLHMEFVPAKLFVKLIEKLSFIQVNLIVTDKLGKENEARWELYNQYGSAFDKHTAVVCRYQQFLEQHYLTIEDGTFVLDTPLVVVEYDEEKYYPTVLREEQGEKLVLTPIMSKDFIQSCAPDRENNFWKTITK